MFLGDFSFVPVEVVFFLLDVVLQDFGGRPRCCMIEGAVGDGVAADARRKVAFELQLV